MLAPIRIPCVQQRSFCDAEAQISLQSNSFFGGWEDLTVWGIWCAFRVNHKILTTFFSTQLWVNASQTVYLRRVLRRMYEAVKTSLNVIGEFSVLSEINEANNEDIISHKEKTAKENISLHSLLLWWNQLLASFKRNYSQGSIRNNPGSPRCFSFRLHFIRLSFQENRK